MDSFRRELEHLINKYSQENGSNTPDFILADYLVANLAVYDAAVNRREQWYNRVPGISAIPTCEHGYTTGHPSCLQETKTIFREHNHHVPS